MSTPATSERRAPPRAACCQVGSGNTGLAGRNMARRVIYLLDTPASQRTTVPQGSRSGIW